MYYRINIVPCYKPWRGLQVYYTKDEKMFEAFNSIDELFNGSLPTSVLNEDDFMNYDAYAEALEQEADDFFSAEEPAYPITIINECWLYSE